MKTETLFSKNSDEWQTPLDLFQDLDREFHFDLDACATHENAMCPEYFTREQDGLEQNWGGRTVWCNPPYSQMKAWARKCFYEGHKPNTIVVMLIPSRTDTWWYQNYVLHRSEVRFIRGRLRFEGSDNNAPFPSALVIYRGAEEKECMQKSKTNMQQITIGEFLDDTD